MHEKTWISWYSRISANMKFPDEGFFRWCFRIYLPIFQLVRYPPSRYHCSYLYWNSFCQKSLILSKMFCQKFPLFVNFCLFRLCFRNFDFNLSNGIFQFFVFDFLIISVSFFQNEVDLRWSCSLKKSPLTFAFSQNWPLVLSLGTFQPHHPILTRIWQILTCTGLV